MRRDNCCVNILTVFAAARFLGYEAGEEQLVDRIVMNLHPTILAQWHFWKGAVREGN